MERLMERLALFFYMYPWISRVATLVLVLVLAYVLYRFLDQGLYLLNVYIAQKSIQREEARKATGHVLVFGQGKRVRHEVFQDRPKKAHLLGVDESWMLTQAIGVWVGVLIFMLLAVGGPEGLRRSPGGLIPVALGVILVVGYTVYSIQIEEDKAKNLFIQQFLQFIRDLQSQWGNMGEVPLDHVFRETMKQVRGRVDRAANPEQELRSMHPLTVWLIYIDHRIQQLTHTGQRVAGFQTGQYLLYFLLQLAKVMQIPIVTEIVTTLIPRHTSHPEEMHHLLASVLERGNTYMTARVQDETERLRRLVSGGLFYLIVFAFLVFLTAPLGAFLLRTPSAVTTISPGLGVP